MCLCLNYRVIHTEEVGGWSLSGYLEDVLMTIVDQLYIAGIAQSCGWQNLTPGI